MRLLSAVLSAQSLWALLPFPVCLQIRGRPGGASSALCSGPGHGPSPWLPGFALMLRAEHTFAHVPLSCPSYDRMSA